VDIPRQGRLRDGHAARLQPPPELILAGEDLAIDQVEDQRLPVPLLMHAGLEYTPLYAAGMAIRPGNTRLDVDGGSSGVYK
jgi:hypothetical protein